MDKLEMLSRTRLFGGLDEKVLAEIAKFAQPIRLGDGGTLIAEGSPRTPDLYVVVDGNFDVITRNPKRPDETMTLGNLGYEVVGEIAWMSGLSRSATVRCRGDVLALCFEGPALLNYLETHPEVGFPVMKQLFLALADKLIDANFFLM